MLALLASPAGAAVVVTGLRCEDRQDPLGIDAREPRLSWRLEADRRGAAQTAYRVLVAGSAERLAADTGDLWDSGQVAGNATLGIAYAGRPLVSGQRCWWKAQVWDEQGRRSAWSTPAVWEMALLRRADWTGAWLNDGRANPARDDDFYRDDPAPLFRKEFNVAKPVRRARLYIAGLGYYEARLNGQRVGDRQLDPGWTMYRQRVFYSAYDVTAQLQPGANGLGVMLGNGWYNPLPLRMWGRYNLRETLAVGRPRFRAQLNIEFTDDSTLSVASDRSWKVSDGPIRFNSIYLGERYDARREQPGWDQPGFDDARWGAPALATELLGQLQAQPQPPIRVIEQFPAVRMTEPQPGVFIFDLGRNFSGWDRFRFKAAAGTKITMRYGELLNKDGTLNPLTSVCGQIKNAPKSNPGGGAADGPGPPPTAWQTDTYIARGGGEETYTPRFTWHAFRYVELSGLTAAPLLELVTGLALCSDVPDAGAFTCSNELFNRIQQMCRRTFRANLFSVQSDCPHRERFGYGGDIVATSDALMMNFDMAGFYAKAVHDWADSVLPDGMLTDTAPFVGIQYCGVGWAMAHPLLVTQLLRYYGNQRLVAEQYEVAKRWLLLVAGQNKSGIIADGLSDHEALDKNPAPVMVTPLYYQSARLLADLARRLGREADGAQFEALAETTRQAYQKQLFDPATGRAGPGTQGSQAFALYSDLVPAADREKTLNVLLADIRDKHAGHLSTGIMGTKFMFDVLSRAGHADAASGIASQTNSPGWGWMLANGATTLWEHWAGSDNTYSHNHPMFGSVSQWFMQWLGGIQPAPDAVGWDRIVLRPQFVANVDWVTCRYPSVRGPIVSNWRRAKGRLQWDVEIPANVTALVYLPTTQPADIREGGRPAAEAEGVKLVRQEQGSALFAVGSGRYRFDTPAPR